MDDKTMRKIAERYAETILDPVFQFTDFIQRLPDSREEDFAGEEKFEKILEEADVLKILSAFPDPRRYDDEFFRKYDCGEHSLLHRLFVFFVGGMDAERKLEAAARPRKGEDITFRTAEWENRM